MSTEKPIVVYTAITGGYDHLKSPPKTLGKDVECIAFLDDKCPRIGNWNFREAHNEFKDGNRNAKIHKVLPHRYFPDAKYSLWIDGSIGFAFNYPVSQLIDTYLGEHDLAVFKHPLRTCLYQEASVCIHAKLDDKDTIREQIYRYTREDYPANNGLCECTVLLRRHSQKMIDFSEMWWDEINKGSRRDQISFNYVAWKTGLTYQPFKGMLFFARNDLFRKFMHNRRRR